MILLEKSFVEFLADDFKRANLRIIRYISFTKANYAHIMYIFNFIP